MIVLGIDPGVSGGLAYLDGERIEVEVMFVKADGTVDAAALAQWLRHLGLPSFAVIERQQHRHGNDAASSFKAGRGYEALQATLQVLGVPYVVAGPKDWQKALGLTVTKPKMPKEPKAKAKAERAHSKNVKKAAAAYCQRRFPGIKLRPEAGKGSKSDFHDGMTDALCIAEYARREAA